jgi:hypothetical protein
VQITPPAIQNIGWKTYIIFAILNAVWVPIIYTFYPETKGLELEDVDRIFAKEHIGFGRPRRDRYAPGSRMSERANGGGPGRNSAVVETLFHEKNPDMLDMGMHGHVQDRDGEAKDV